MGGPAPFELKPWLEDLDQVREAVATKYANLEWVVLEREIDLAALSAAEAITQLQSASRDLDARPVFDRLAALRPQPKAVFGIQLCQLHRGPFLDGLVQTHAARARE